MDTPPPLNPSTPRDGQNGPTIELVPTPSAEADRSWCIGLHLAGLSGLVLPFALANIVAPLVIWLLKRAGSPAIDATGKEVLNFQISYTIYMAVAGALCWVLIGLLILPVVFFIWLLSIIVAAVKTSNGQPYAYPGVIRFLR